MPSVMGFAGNRVKLKQHRGVVDRLDDGRGDHLFRGAGPENGVVGVDIVFLNNPIFHYHRDMIRRTAAPCAQFCFGSEYAFPLRSGKN